MALALVTWTNCHLATANLQVRPILQSNTIQCDPMRYNRVVNSADEIVSWSANRLLKQQDIQPFGFLIGQKIVH